MWRRSAARRRSSIPACASICCSPRRSLHDVGRTRELDRGPSFAVTDEGRLLGHVHLGTRLIEAHAEGLTPPQLAELVHCVSVHHEARGARTAEAAVLYHANQLDAVAATRRVD